jgi:hypothetical protein
VKADAVRAYNEGRWTQRSASHEEKMIQQLGILLNSRHEMVRPVAFDLPDIIAALPDDSSRRVIEGLHGKAFPGWAELVSAHRAKPRPANFKDFVLKELHLNLSMGQLPGQILEEAPEDSLVAAELRTAINEAMVHLGSSPAHSSI